MPTKPLSHSARLRKARPREHRQGSTARGYGYRWQKFRLWFLANNPLCVECLKEGRTTAASEVDHIVPHKGDQELFWREGNHQALCKPCHDRKTANEDGGFGRPRKAGVTVVAGPPGSGKTTYVALHRQPGDIIVDVDALFSAITGLPWYEKPPQCVPFVLAARDALIDTLTRPSDVRHAWVITAAPGRERWEAMAKRLGANVVVLDVPADECLSRIEADGRRTDSHPWGKLIADWWSSYGCVERADAGSGRRLRAAH